MSPPVAMLRHFRNGRPTGIGKPQHRGYLVKCLTCRIVNRPAQVAEIGRRFATVQIAVAAADHEAHAGKHIPAAGDPAGVDVDRTWLTATSGLPSATHSDLAAHEAHETE